MKNITVVLIIGLVLIACLLFLNKTEASDGFDRVGKYQIVRSEQGCYVLDTIDGFVWEYHVARGWRYAGRPLMSDIPVDKKPPTYRKP